MKTQNTLKKTLVAALTTMVGFSALAQSTTSVMIPLSPKSFEKMAGDDVARLNLVNEARKINPVLKNVPNLEIQMIRLEAKTGIGGGQVFLRVNNKMVDSQTVETNPDILETSYEFQRVELKNIDRSLVTEASLVIQSFSNTRLQSLEVVMGPVQEPVVFGRYADDQIANIGGAVVNTSETEGNINDVRPSAEVVSAVLDRYYHQDTDVLGGVVVSTPTYPGATTVPAVPVPAPVVGPTTCAAGFELRRDFNGTFCARVAAVAPVPVAPAPPAPVKQCVKHPKRYDVCVGDKVKNKWGFPGVVVAVDVRRSEVSVRFEYKDKVDTRDVDSVSK